MMKEVLSELYRVTKRGGYVAFEVGEVRKKSIQLERHIVPLGQAVGFSCQAILINQQNFTTTGY